MGGRSENSRESLLDSAPQTSVSDWDLIPNLRFFIKKMWRLYIPKTTVKTKPKPNQQTKKKNTIDLDGFLLFLTQGSIRPRPLRHLHLLGMQFLLLQVFTKNLPMVHLLLLSKLTECVAAYRVMALGHAQKAAALAGHTGKTLAPEQSSTQSPGQIAHFSSAAASAASKMDVAEGRHRKFY